MTAPVPQPDCRLHPDVEVGDSPIEGRGLFARALIPAGTVVSRLGGRPVSTAELRRLIDDPDQPYVDTITVAADRHLVLPPRRANGYGNHGCDPEPVVDRPLRAGRPARRRGVVTGSDRRRPELRARYGRHWVPALLARIEAGA